MSEIYKESAIEDGIPPEDDTTIEVADQFESSVEVDLMGNVSKDTDADLSPGFPEVFVQQYLRDHFTLAAPSSTIRFRSAHNAARVFENRSTQFILEETYDPTQDKRVVRVKQLRTATKGLEFLRALYSVVCILWLGFFFMLCLQVLLILVLDVAVATGSTDTGAELNVGALIGIVLAIFWFSRGFSSALVIGSTFVADVWGGHYLLKQFFFPKRLTTVFVDWLFFGFFVFIPVFTLCVTLLMGKDDWWSITSLLWFSCVGAFYLLFAINCVYFEVAAAISFSKRQDGTGMTLVEVLKHCILLRQVRHYSGMERTSFMARSVINANDGKPVESADIYESTRETSSSIWTKISLWDANSSGFFFAKVDPKIKLSSIDDVRDNRPYVTKYTFSLERLFCRPQRSRYVAIVEGPGALTKGQIISSLVCSLIGTFLTLLVVVSFLVWLNLPTALVSLVAVGSIIFSWFHLADLRRVAKVAKTLFEIRGAIKDEGVADASPQYTISKRSEHLSSVSDVHDIRVFSSSRRPSELIETPSEGVFLVAENFRITRAKDGFCWFMVFVEVVLFFIYPTVTLFSIGDWPMGCLFVAVGTVTALRHYVSVGCIVEETGDMSFAGGKNAKERWLKQSRLSDIIESVTYDKSRRLWSYVLLGFAGLIVVIFLSALGDTGDPSFMQELSFIPDFYYEKQPLDVRYPTCVLATDDNSFDKSLTMADYVFLTMQPYKPDSLAARELSEWFSDLDIEEDLRVVQDFRKDSKTENIPLFFRFFRISTVSDDSASNSTIGIISIRGTQNKWELLADSQLWSASMLMQLVRAILPLGEIWTPILDELVATVNKLQVGVIDSVSFYKVTTAFAKQMKKDDSLDRLFVTGHSLGGGLAMITGAQAKIPAVALSGPNSKISGRSFEPKVTADELNRYTFNIIPERDIVPRFDDVADNFQNIRCTSSAQNFAGCHGFTRSLCEILYTCGTGGRPALCECHKSFGYPKPLTNGNRTFEEACPL